MPPWNPVFGHLLVLDEIFKTQSIPPDIQMPDAFAELSRKFSDESDSLLYLDLWPFVGPLMLTSSPNHANQAEMALDRPSDLQWSLHPVAGGPNIFSTNGTIWKEAKSILSAGFNNTYVMKQINEVLDEANVLVRTLTHPSSKNTLFKLDEVMGRYTMDISGRMTL